MAWANSVDPDYPAHLCTVCFLVRNNPINQNAKNLKQNFLSKLLLFDEWRIYK
jgi:hypothetical protein